MTEIVPTRIVAPARTAPARPVPRPHGINSVGQIAGLSPRRRRGDGGEVPGADVDTIDALPRAVVWPTVAAWLTDARAATTRRGYLADAAAFVRWLSDASPGVELLAADRDTLTAYRDALATGAATGRPLAASSIARRLSSLSSLFAYAVTRDVLDANPVDKVRRPEVGTEGTTPALAEAEAAALLEGAEAIAGESPADAAAVALLLLCAVRVGELVGLAVGDLQADANHLVLIFRRKGGKTARVPVPPRARALLEPLRAGRPGAALLLCDKGAGWDRWRVTTALRRAARAGGLSRERAYQITPHMARATAATLLLDAKVPVRDVQQMLGHASPVTTVRYDRGARRLDGHAAYRLAHILGGGS